MCEGVTMRHRASIAGSWLLLLGSSTGFQLAGRGLRRPRINGQIVTATSSWVPGCHTKRVSRRGTTIHRLGAAQNDSDKPDGIRGPSSSSEGAGIPSDSLVEFTDILSSAIEESTRSEVGGPSRSESPPESTEMPLTLPESSLMKALSDAAASFRRAAINATNSNAADVSAAERLFAMADSDADGVLTLPEFKRWLETPEGAAAADAFAMSPESEEAKAVAAEKEATNVQGLVELVSAEAAAGAKLRVVANALLEGVVALAGKAPDSGNRNNKNNNNNNNNITTLSSTAAAAAVAEAAAAAGATDPAAAAAVSAGFAAGFTAGAAAGAAAATGGNGAEVTTTPTPLLEAARGIVASNASPDVTPLLPPAAVPSVAPPAAAGSALEATGAPPSQLEDTSVAVTAAPDATTSTSLPPPSTAEPSNRPFESLVQDFKRRAASYKSDWTDGWASRGKVSSAVLLLYVACLAPTVSFGGLAAVLTEGQIGVVEFLVSHGVSGMLYAVLSGQPMTFIAPTGLTLAFMAALYRFCEIASLPFLATYGWVGLWTSSFLTLAAVGGFGKLIRILTSFTDDVFNALLGLNFLVQACQSLLQGFVQSGPDKTSPFLALNFALLTAFSSMKLSETRKSKLFNKPMREFLSDFGPVTVILALSLISLLPGVASLGMEFLQVPAEVGLAGGRALFLQLGTVPLWARWAAALPAVLLTMLFYLDHLITARVVNAPRHKMKKGAAYDLDLLALGGIVALQSVCGLPWMCGATVQSLNHIRAMATYGEPGEVAEHQPLKTADDDSAGSFFDDAAAQYAVVPAPAPPSLAARFVKATGAMAGAFKEAFFEGTDQASAVDANSTLAVSNATDPTVSIAAERAAALELAEAATQVEIIGMVETRLSGLLLHSAILGSVMLLPLLGAIPMPVIYGIFLYLGRKVMTGNAFLKRLTTIFYDEDKLPPTSVVIQLGRRKVAQYIGIQAVCLATLWALKSFKPTAIFFPSVIGGLVVIRQYLLPKLFNKEELERLDSSNF